MRDGDHERSFAANPVQRFTAGPTTAQWADLRARLRATRWPTAPAVAEWSLGADPSYMRELVEYWAEDYDWPKHEAALNQIPRFHTDIGGLSIHFAQIEGTSTGIGPRMPLLLTHG